MTKRRQRKRAEISIEQLRYRLQWYGVDLQKGWKPDSHRRPAFVYFCQALPGGTIKIGHTRDVAARLAGLECWSPTPIHLLLAFPTPNSPWMERAFHWHFRALRWRNEFFRPDLELLALIDALKAVPDDVDRAWFALETVWPDAFGQRLFAEAA